MNLSPVVIRNTPAPRNAMSANRGALEGEVMREVAVTSEEMARMNEARAVFNELRSILLSQVVPALGGWTNPMATEIESRLEAVTFASRNFLWPHRHAGAAHDAIHVEAGQ